LDAIGQLNFYILNLNRLSRQNHIYRQSYREALYSIYFFLRHACTISYILWPPIPRNSPNRKIAADKALCTHSESSIIKNIKKRLGAGSRHLLKNKKLRENFNDHAGLDWLRSIKEDCQNNTIGFASPIAYPPLFKKVFHFNPVSRNLYFSGETYNIQDAAEAIFKLLKYARDEQEKQRTLSRGKHISVGLASRKEEKGRDQLPTSVMASSPAIDSR